MRAQEAHFRSVVGTSAKNQVESDENLVALWLEGRSQCTRKNYAADVRRLQAFVAKPFTLIGLSDVQDFVLSLEKLSVSNRARIISSVKSLFAFGYRLGYLTFSLADSVRAPKAPSRVTERILTEVEVNGLFGLEESARNHALLRTLYIGGLRVSELVSLCWRDVTLACEADSQMRILESSGKTRIMFLPAKLAAELEALRGDAGQGDALFPSRQGGTALCAHQVTRVVREAGRRAGISRNVSAQCLRHTHVNHALAHGCPAHVVQQSLGISSLDNASHYTRAGLTKPNDSSSRYLDSRSNIRKISVTEAVATKGWLHCSVNDEGFQFRLRLLAFEKVRVSEIDNKEKMQSTDEGIWWLIRIEIVNLNKRDLSTMELNRILLEDQNGFQFSITTDNHLRFFSDYAKRMGLSRLYGEPLRPKIKVAGAIPFLLPVEAEAEYSLVMNGGTICEA